MRHVRTDSCPTRRASDLAVVEDREGGAVAVTEAEDGDGPLRRRELGRIGDQIYQDLADQAGIGVEDREVVGDRDFDGGDRLAAARSEEHTSELQSLMRSSDAVFCLTQNSPSVDFS